MDTRRTEQLTAWAFLTPALVVLVGFGLFPIGYAFYVSLHKWRIKKEALIGFEHYVRALGDPQNLVFLLFGVVIVWAAYRLRSHLLERGLPSAYVYLAWGILLLPGLGCCSSRV